MLSLAEISDRLEIQQLLVDYSSAIDQRRFDDLDEVFTPDAYIDFRALGGVDGRYPKVKAWLAEVLPNFPMYSHMLGNFSVRINGDTEASPMLMPGPR
jgi:SnoaL-like domain